MVPLHRGVLFLLALSVLAAAPSYSDEQQHSHSRRLHAQVQTSTKRPEGLGPNDPWCDAAVPGRMGAAVAS